MPIKYTINDAYEKDGQKTVLLSASVGTITVMQEFVINNILDRTIVISTLQGLLSQQVIINNQFNSLKARIGQDF